MNAAIRRTRLVTACAAAICTASGTDIASAHDSLAPPGSSHNWLPDEHWVHRHWIPFHEERLKAALGLHGLDLHAYLYDDHHTIAALARRRGLDVDELANRLLAPWRNVDEPRRAALRERTLRILTQGHLSQHMFFHVFHGLHLDRFAPGLFGMHAPAYLTLRDQGLTWTEILEGGGVPLQTFRSSFGEMLDADLREGVTRQEAWAPQSDRIRARTLAWLPCWLDRPKPSLDGANPYGKNRSLHGRHAAGWPANARERREDERRVERFRARVPPSCWQIPPPWRPPARAARTP